MKLSTAMMLGDVIAERTNSTYLERTQSGWCGCAIGRSVLACGGSTSSPIPESHRLWPWLKEVGPHGFQHRVLLGAGHFREPSFVRVMSNEITFEQLVDYVRSIEPDCGECNRFECSCVKSAAVPEAEMAVQR